MYAVDSCVRYRYGYQGSEQDNEIKGNGNSYTTHFRQLDPRIGRWLSIDPVTQPGQSPYCSMDNSPILGNDVLGNYTKFKDKQAKKDFDTAHDKVKSKVQELGTGLTNLSNELQSEGLGKKREKQIYREIEAMDKEFNDWNGLAEDFENIINDKNIMYEYTSDISVLGTNENGKVYSTNIGVRPDGTVEGEVNISIRPFHDEAVVHENRHGNQIRNLDYKGVKRTETDAFNAQKIYNSHSVEKNIKNAMDSYYGKKLAEEMPKISVEKMVEIVYEDLIIKEKVNEKGN